MKPVSPVIRNSDLPEIKIAEHQPEFQTLPALHINGVTITRWLLDEDERKRIAETGEIYLSIERGANALQPVMLSLDPPEIAKPLSKEVIVPNDLGSCLFALEDMLNKKDLDYLRDSRETVIDVLHHSLGRWIRNNWNLWKVEGYENKDYRLHDYFVQCGLWHADDMSGLILTSFWRYLHKEPLRIEEQIEHYKIYWARQEWSENAHP